MTAARGREFGVLPWQAAFICLFTVGLGQALDELKLNPLKDAIAGRRPLRTD